MSLIELLIDLLPARLRDKAKAVTATATGLVAPLLLTGLTTGQWDKAAIVGVVVAIIVGGGTYVVPNRKR